MENPKYLARKADGAVWEINEDGTYTRLENKGDPNRPQTKHEYQTLLRHKFYPVTEEDFPKLKEKFDEYYEWFDWTNRSDGHGGVKGGTIEEFRAIKNK